LLQSLHIFTIANCHFQMKFDCAILRVRNHRKKQTRVHTILLTCWWLRTDTALGFLILKAMGAMEIKCKRRIWHVISFGLYSAGTTQEIWSKPILVAAHPIPRPNRNRNSADIYG